MVQSLAEGNAESSADISVPLLIFTHSVRWASAWNQRRTFHPSHWSQHVCGIDLPASL